MSIPHSKLGRVCSFAFADGRHCRTPRSPEHPHLCYFRAKKEAESRAAQEIGYDIGSWLTGDYVSACDLTRALGRVFSNTAQGKIKPRTAVTLAYPGQTLAYLIPKAQNEYVHARGVQSWLAEIRNSIEAESSGPSVRPPTSASPLEEDPESETHPAPQPVSQTA